MSKKMQVLALDVAGIKHPFDHRKFSTSAVKRIVGGVGLSSYTRDIRRRKMMKMSIVTLKEKKKISRKKNPKKEQVGIVG